MRGADVHLISGCFVDVDKLLRRQNTSNIYTRIMDGSTAGGVSTRKKVALVTGAAQGIGRAVALRLAKDGYKVALNDLPSAKANLESLQEEIGSLRKETTKLDTLLVMGDVSAEEEVQGMVNSCVENLGGLDVVSSQSRSQSNIKNE